MSAGFEIVIDELVVHGLSHADADLVASSLVDALGGVVRDWAASGEAKEVTGRDEASRRAGVALEATPGALGVQLAGVVWQAVTGGPR